MVLKGVKRVHIYKVGQMILKGISWVNNTKFRSYGLERDQLGTICKTNNIFKVSWDKLM